MQIHDLFLGHGACHINISMSDDAKSTGRERTYHQGDLLTGRLSIHYDERTIIEDITLTLEGFARVWVDHKGYASAVKYEFLKQTHKFSRHAWQLGKAHCWMDFNFRIASSCFPSESTRPHLALLPPSLCSGEACLDREGNKCMQPLISYGLRAVVYYRSSPRGPRLQRQEFKDIVFSPWTEVHPPVTIEDFPGEYRLEAIASVRRRFSRCLLGTIMVSTQELPPLSSSTNTPNPQTRGHVNLSFEPCVSFARSQSPRWSCEIRLGIIRRIYYTTMPLAGVASDHLLRNNEYLRKREEVVNSQRWTVQPLYWDDSSSESRLAAAIPLTIQPAVELIPAFSMPLVTLRYSYRVTLRIIQVSHSTLELEAPLQVHNTPHATSVDRHGELDGPGSAANSHVRRDSELPPAYFA